MSRFDATSPAERIDLVVAAIRAHRARGSAFLTLETDPEIEDSSTGPPPWVQYRDQDKTLNLDCTEAELDSIRAAIDEFGGVRITDQHETEAGTNLRIEVPGDDERVAQVIESLLLDGFGCPEDVRLWAAAV
ncbi:MAG: hypothetical protein ACQEQJ_08145 [Halobacteriota archaeon]